MPVLHQKRQAAAVVAGVVATLKYIVLYHSMHISRWNTACFRFTDEWLVSL
jgi:hypothetical protein